MSVSPWLSRRAPELSKFSAVGVAGVLVDAGVFNLLAWVVFDGAYVVTAKIIATAVAIVSAWWMHRVWTFRSRRAHSRRREFTLFVAVNVVAMAIQALVVAVAYYPLELRGVVAGNVAAYGVGLPLSTVARYIGYRLFVFSGSSDRRDVASS